MPSIDAAGSSIHTGSLYQYCASDTASRSGSVPEHNFTPCRLLDIHTGRGGELAQDPRIQTAVWMGLVCGVLTEKLGLLKFSCLHSLPTLWIQLFHVWYGQHWVPASTDISFAVCRHVFSIVFRGRQMLVRIGCSCEMAPLQSSPVHLNLVKLVMEKQNRTPWFNCCNQMC